jgi:hypothetical protein
MPERLLNITWVIRTISPYSVPWDASDLVALEDDATKFLRGFVRGGDKVEKEGTYVTMDWVETNPSKNLLFDVRVADEPRAQVVLCCASMAGSQQDKRAKKRVQSFAFALVHGDAKTYEIMLKWIEMAKGCVVGRHSFRPTTAHVTELLSETLQASEGEQGQLSVTFGTPRSIENLDEISIMVPPRSLHRLMNDIEGSMPDDKRRKTNEDDATSVVESKRQFLKALRLYILEAFHMDIQAFSIVKICNPLVMFGVSGKLLLLDKPHMDSVFALVGRMVKELVDSGKLDETRQQYVSKQPFMNAHIYEDRGHGEGSAIQHQLNGALNKREADIAKDSKADTGEDNADLEVSRIVSI